MQKDVAFKYKLFQDHLIQIDSLLQNIEIKSIKPYDLIRLEIDLGIVKSFVIKVNPSITNKEIYYYLTDVEEKGKIIEPRDDLRISFDYLFKSEKNKVIKYMVRFSNNLEETSTISFQETAYLVNVEDFKPNYTKELIINTQIKNIFQIKGWELKATDATRLYIYFPSLYGFEANIFISDDLNLFKEMNDEKVVFTQNIANSGIVSYMLPDKTFEYNKESSLYVYIKVNSGIGSIVPEFFFSSEDYIYGSLSNIYFNLNQGLKANVLLSEVPTESEVSIFIEGKANLSIRTEVGIIKSIFTHFNEKNKFTLQEKNVYSGLLKPLYSLIIESNSSSFANAKLYYTVESNIQKESFNLGDSMILSINSNSIIIPLNSLNKPLLLNAYLIDDTESEIKVNDIIITKEVKSISIKSEVKSITITRSSDSSEKVRLLLTSKNNHELIHLNSGINTVKGSNSYYFKFPEDYSIVSDHIVSIIIPKSIRISKCNYFLS